MTKCSLLKNIRQIVVDNQKHISNWAYYPILFENEETLQKVIKYLNTKNYFPRRYFFPSLDTVYQQNNKLLVTSRNLSKRVLCLPIYPNLDLSSVDEISDLIMEVTKN